MAVEPHKQNHESLYIGGAWRGGASGKTFPVIDPATEDMICEVSDATDSDAEDAITAAADAFPKWAALSGRERGSLLLRAKAVLEERLESIARTMTKEQGKPLSESRGELSGCVEFLEWYGEEAKRIYGEVISGYTVEKRQLVIKQPVGVVAAITPWNFPAMMIVRKAASALAAGCTVIAKPAEQTPLTAVAIFEVFHDAGFPPGVVNLLTTSNPQQVGDVLLDDPRVRAITFTGSTEVGKVLSSRAARQIKRVSLELGGHAPFIIFEDADLDEALIGLAQTKFKNAGQTCVNPNRIYVHSSIVEEFGARLSEMASQLKVGNGFREDVQMGPLIDAQGLEKVTSHVEDALSRGASVLTGGEPYKEDGCGYFYRPTVLSGIRSDMQITREETFGPVAPLIPFDSEEEVIATANATEYGLSAYFYTRDLKRAIRVSEHLEYGVVGVNDNRPGSAQTPFGGFKESGAGREGGHYGMDEFLESKCISLKL